MSSADTLARATEAILQAADQAMARKDWTAALGELERGLALMGDQYASGDTIDDTGMKLVLANAEAKKGNAQNAATLKHRVLASRLAQLRQKPQPPARPSR